MKALFWYSARNSPFYEDENTYEGRFGLMTTRWQLKPSYTALRAYALGLPQAKVLLRKSSQHRLPAGDRPAARVTLRGRVALGQGAAAARVSRRVVVVQRRTRAGWARVARLQTSTSGAFRVSLVARGTVVRYRAVVRAGTLRAQSRVLRIFLR